MNRSRYLVALLASIGCLALSGVSTGALAHDVAPAAVQTAPVQGHRTELSSQGRRGGGGGMRGGAGPSRRRQCRADRPSGRQCRADRPPGRKCRAGRTGRPHRWADRPPRADRSHRWAHRTGRPLRLPLRPRRPHRVCPRSCAAPRRAGRSCRSGSSCWCRQPVRCARSRPAWSQSTREPNLTGLSVETAENQPRLDQSRWQNQISSIMVKSGTWDFYPELEFRGQPLRLSARILPGARAAMDQADRLVHVRAIGSRSFKDRRHIKRRPAHWPGDKRLGSILNGRCPPTRIAGECLHGCVLEPHPTGAAGHPRRSGIVQADRRLSRRSNP